MKARPIIELFFLLALFAAAWVPLTRLTGRSASSPAAVSSPSLRPEIARSEGAEAGALARVFAQVRFAHRPLSASIETLDGRQLWSRAKGAEGLVDETEFETNLAADGGIDLVVKAQWAADIGETAVEVRVEPDGMPSQSETFWGRGEIEKIFVISREGGEGR